MQRRAPVGEVAEHDAQIDGAREDADAEPADAARCGFGKIGGCNDSRLPDAQSHDEASCEDLSVAAIGGDEDYHADDPDDTQLAGGPDASWGC